MDAPERRSETTTTQPGPCASVSAPASSCAAATATPRPPVVRGLAGRSQRLQESSTDLNLKLKRSLEVCVELVFGGVTAGKLPCMHLLQAYVAEGPRAETPPGSGIHGNGSCAGLRHRVRTWPGKRHSRLGRMARKHSRRPECAVQVAKSGWSADQGMETKSSGRSIVPYPSPLTGNGREGEAEAQLVELLRGAEGLEGLQGVH